MERRGIWACHYEKEYDDADLRELDVVEESRPLSVEEKCKKETTSVELDKLILMEEICWRQKS